MIIQSPESEMPEPYTTYVRQRSETIASVLKEVVEGSNVQLCPRAITPGEQIFKESGAIVYGAVVKDISDGYKSVLYSPRFSALGNRGIATANPQKAAEYTARQLTAGNRVRIKDPHESDGQGQHIAETIDDTLDIFQSINSDNKLGVVLMPHLEKVMQRISIGRIALGGLGTFYYIGREKTLIHQGVECYGGTSLGLFHGGSRTRQAEVEQRLDIPSSLSRMGIAALGSYEKLVLAMGRVSVDVIEGVTDNGTRLQDIIDITPRVGGTTPAEVLAIREIHKDKNAVCFSASQLLYNPNASPKTGTNFIDTSSLVINAQVQEVKK